jgi:hypothetical protein
LNILSVKSKQNIKWKNQKLQQNNLQWSRLNPGLISGVHVEEAATSRFAMDRMRALRLLLCSLKLRNKKMYGFASASIQKTNPIATVPTTICNENELKE